MKYIFCFLVLCAVTQLPAQNGLRSFPPACALAAAHAPALKPRVFNCQHGINLHLPVTSHHGFFKKPILANNFNMDIYPDSRSRLRFINRWAYTTGQRLKLTTVYNPT